jgi:hypothetical protein
MPFLAGLVASAVLAPLRLSGLSVAAGFATAVYLVVGFDFTPLTTVRKIMLLGLIAPAVGVAVDLAFKPTRIMVPFFAAALGACSVWVFLAILRQKEIAQAVLLGGGAAIYVAWTVGSLLVLRDNPVRAGAASFALGLGTGVAAVLAASATLGLYGMAFGTAASAFLLMQMVTGKRSLAGVTLTLTSGLLGGLLGIATVYLAELRWHSLAVLALVPLAVRVPVPSKWPVWAQVVITSLPALAVAAAACFLAWQASRGAPG